MPTPTTASATPPRAEALLCVALGLATLALAGALLAGEAAPSLEQRLAAAPANPALWLEKAERDDDPAALRLSLLTGPHDPVLEPRQRALAARLGALLDDETRARLR
jgi:hypothetical protein